MFGGDGAGFLYGGPGAETLNAGPNLTTKTDSDFLAGEAGNDTLVESPSRDRYGFGPGWGQDSLTGDGDQPGVQSDSDGLCFACSGIVADSVNISLAAGTATDGTNSVTWARPTTGRSSRTPLAALAPTPSQEACAATS